ncbi:MAG: hypothetical protein JKY49_08590 [Cohaesibacteraceae bacterium]|nr:hypothetical protein [Cohaesibacteraceae bacterium]MBL4876716.1 hypothetical protein [Cohaesibacteraceae bacterium]
MKVRHFIYGALAVVAWVFLTRYTQVTDWYSQCCWPMTHKWSSFVGVGFDLVGFSFLGWELWRGSKIDHSNRLLNESKLSWEKEIEHKEFLKTKKSNEFNRGLSKIFKSLSFSGDMAIPIFINPKKLKKVDLTRFDLSRIDFQSIPLKKISFGSNLNSPWNYGSRIDQDLEHIKNTELPKIDASKVHNEQAKIEHSEFRHYLVRTGVFLILVGFALQLLGAWPPP